MDNTHPEVPSGLPTVCLIFWIRRDNSNIITRYCIYFTLSVQIKYTNLFLVTCQILNTFQLSEGHCLKIGEKRTTST